LKRFWPLVGVLALALLLPVATSGDAANGTTVSVAAPIAVGRGSDFVARISIGNVTDLDAYQFDLSYDPAVVQVEGPEGGVGGGIAPGLTGGIIGTTWIPVDMWNYQPPATPGRVRVLGNLPGVNGVTGSGYMCDVHFQVVGPAGSESSLTFSDGLLFNGMGEEIAPTWVDGLVHICLAGDTNGDACVGIGDVTKVERIIMGLDQATPCSDPSGDGCVDIRDITAIERIILLGI